MSVAPVLAETNAPSPEELTETIDEYVQQDLAANLWILYYDIGDLDPKVLEA